MKKTGVRNENHKTSNFVFIISCLKFRDHTTHSE